jgi:PPM family protein phosphatase
MSSTAPSQTPWQALFDGDTPHQTTQAHHVVTMASCTRVGARQHNEDDWRAALLPQGAYAVLSDGAGGHHGGEVAADLTVRLVETTLQALPNFEPDNLTQATLDAHQAILAGQHGGAAAQHMHATMVALWIHQNTALWTHVGDSRLYWLRGGQVWHVTRDDSVVQQLVDAGLISDEDARHHPHKNQLLCAMGMDAPVTPHTTEHPTALQEGDAFLLCSDGWWEPLTHGDIENSLARSASPSDWLERMATQISAVMKPTQDNYTAIALWVGDPTQTTRAMPLR